MDVSSKRKLLCEESDETLALLAKDGNEDAIAILVQRYVPFVFLRAKSFAKGELDADDLCQEGMIALLKAIREYRSEAAGNFKTFASVCVNHKLISAVKSHMRNKNAPMRQYLSLSEPGKLAEQLAADELQTDPERLVIASEELDARNRRIKTLLSDFERKVLKLYLSSYSYEEMSRQLGSSVKAVDNALQRVRRKLRSVFVSE